MPGKSRRRKGKYLAKSKRRKVRLSQPTVAAQQQAVAQPREPVARPIMPATSARVPVRCRSCGQANPPRARFCSSCGAALAVVSAPSTSMPAPAAKPVAMRYLNVATELRTIAILAGILLVILIVLSLVPLPW